MRWQAASQSEIGTNSTAARKPGRRVLRRVPAHGVLKQQAVAGVDSGCCCYQANVQ